LATNRLRKAHLLLSSEVKQYTKSKFPMRDLSDAVNSIDRARAFMEADETSSSTANTIDAVKRRAARLSVEPPEDSLRKGGGSCPLPQKSVGRRRNVRVRQLSPD